MPCLQDGVSIATFNPNFGGKQDDGDEFEGEKKVVRLTANDSLSALLAVQLDAQLMVTFPHHTHTPASLPFLLLLPFPPSSSLYLTALTFLPFLLFLSPSYFSPFLSAFLTPYPSHPKTLNPERR